MNDAQPGPAEARLTPVAFWYLRHGQTDWNTKDLSQGDLEVPLNETGLQQARDAAKLMRNRGVATIIASPLGRAQVTAGIVAETLGLPFATDPGLREASYGAKEGQPMAGWYQDWVDGRFTPQGAESFAALRARAVAAINRAVAQPPAVLVVAHGALFRAIRAAMGLVPNVRAANGIPLFCEPPPGGDGPWSLTPATEL